MIIEALLSETLKGDRYTWPALSQAIIQQADVTAQANTEAGELPPKKQSKNSADSARHPDVVGSRPQAQCPLLTSYLASSLKKTGKTADHGKHCASETKENKQTTESG